MFGISLNNKNPIHEQISERITELVLEGVLEPSSPLPSVRELASDLGINPNTVQRAYGELERRGITYSVTGKGRFVTDDVENAKRIKAEESFEKLKKEIEKAMKKGVLKEDIINYLKGDSEK